MPRFWNDFRKTTKKKIILAAEESANRTSLWESVLSLKLKFVRRFDP
jgi:hypothetical protein